MKWRSSFHPAGPEASNIELERGTRSVAVAAMLFCGSGAAVRLFVIAVVFGFGFM